MLWVLFSVAIVIAVYFATRFFLLKKAMKEANREFQDILKDIQQNQILHMAMPDKELENMAQSVNQALEQIRTERQEYEKRERAFQSEIENISHDLRTPLTVILGYLKLMKGQKETDMEMVETIERKAKTMQRLVTDFYDLSRLSARDYEVEIKETDVGRILRESLMDSYHILEKRALELEAEIPGAYHRSVRGCIGVGAYFFKFDSECRTICTKFFACVCKRAKAAGVDLF